MFSQTRAIALKFGTKLADSYREVGIATAVALAPVLSFAQAADPFDAAVADIQTKVGGYGAKLVALAAVAVVFFVAIKYVKKIPRAS